MRFRQGLRSRCAFYAKRHLVEIESVFARALEALMYHLTDAFICFLQSLFSVGATGTIVFGLASKDLASQLISGLTLHLSEKMFEVRSTACTETPFFGPTVI